MDPAKYYSGIMGMRSIGYDIWTYLSIYHKKTRKILGKRKNA
jgi:hypothetical protein